MNFNNLYTVGVDDTHLDTNINLLGMNEVTISSDEAL